MKLPRPYAYAAIGGCAIIGIACADTSVTKQPSCMPLAPTQLQLEGTLTREDRLGAPGYGETPETDERLEILMLGLSSPISICPDSAGGITDTLRGVAQIQLSLDPEIKIGPLTDIRRVRVEGALSEGVLGPQFAPIVMTVTTLTPLQ